MTDYNINLTLQNIWVIFRILMDISVMWILLYLAIKFVRNNSRTMQIFKGIAIILVANGLANLLGLNTLAYFSSLLINWGFLAAIIVFQPEIRGLLERIGKTNAFSKINSLLANEREMLVDTLYEATITLSKNRTGALISIEQSQSMQDYIKTGIEVNGQVSKELLCSIFMTTTPLHDGAVIIQGNKVACASAYFPPTSLNLSSRYGARHRAALGISEVSDALTIVVSEETSAISIAERGKIFSVDDKQLRDYLRRVICGDNVEIAKQSKQRNSLLIDDETEIVIATDEKQPTKGIFSFFAKQPSNRNEKNREPDMKVPFNNRFKYENKDKQDKDKSESSSIIEEAVDDAAIEIADNTLESAAMNIGVENSNPEETAMEKESDDSLIEAEIIDEGSFEDEITDYRIMNKEGESDQDGR